MKKDIIICGVVILGLLLIVSAYACQPQPAPSPAGNRITFESSRDGNWEIYVVDVDGSDQTRLTNNLGGDGEPAWSP